MLIHNATFTGSFSYNGVDISTITSSADTSASFATRVASLESTASVLTAASGTLDARVIKLESTASILVAASASLSTTSGSLNDASASLSTTSGSLNAGLVNVIARTGSFATTGSNVFYGNQTVSASMFVSGSITATGQIVAQTINVQSVTSSVVYSSGSNVFGNDVSNSQTFTGSLRVTGSNALFNVGCIGIGTTTPGYKLEVCGPGSDINIIGASSGDVATGFRIGRGASLGAEIYDNPQDNITTVNAVGGLNFRSGNSSRFSLNCVGIASFTCQVCVGGSLTVNGERLVIGGTTNNAVINNIASVRINIDSDNSNVGESFAVGHNQETIDNNNVLFKVQDDGKVGIGTNSPDLTLSVSGSINMRNSTRAGAFEIDSSGNLWVGTATTAGNIYLETGHTSTGLPSTGTARLNLNSTAACFSSNVCVGGVLTVNGASIDVNCSNTTNTDARINMYTSNNVNGDRATIYGYNLAGTTGGNEITYLAFGYCSTNVQGYINMQTKSGASWCNTMSLRNGLVGIGTTTPGAKLEVNGAIIGTSVGIGGSPLTELYLNSGTIRVDGSTPLLYLRGGSSGAKGAITLNHFGFTDFSINAGCSGNYILGITKTPGGTDGILLYCSGDVGIGISDPQSYSAKLTVAGNIRASVGCAIGVWDSSNTTYVQFSSPSSRNLRITNDAGTEYFRLSNPGIGCFAGTVCAPTFVGSLSGNASTSTRPAATATRSGNFSSGTVNGTENVDISSYYLPYFGPVWFYFNVGYNGNGAISANWLGLADAHYFNNGTANIIWTDDGVTGGASLPTISVSVQGSTYTTRYLRVTFTATGGYAPNNWNWTFGAWNAFP